MKKSDFLAELQTAVCKTAVEALAGTPWSEKGCPYIERWFGYYQAQDAQHVERAVRKYAPETGSATTARDYISIIGARVRGPIEVWAKTRQITGVPEGPSMPPPNAPTTDSTPTSDTAAGTTTAPLTPALSFRKLLTAAPERQATPKPFRLGSVLVDRSMPTCNREWERHSAKTFRTCGCTQTPQQVSCQRISTLVPSPLASM